MTITQVRKLLNKQEMDELTEKAIKNGAFVVENVRRIAGAVSVSVSYPRTGKRREIIL